MAARLVIVVKRSRHTIMGDGWFVGTPTDLRERNAQWVRRKRDAVSQGVHWCHGHVEAGGRAQLRVYGHQGLQHERTYPRSSDPRKSKG